MLSLFLCLFALLSSCATYNFFGYLNEFKRLQKEKAPELSTLLSSTNQFQLKKKVTGEINKESPRLKYEGMIYTYSKGSLNSKTNFIRTRGYFDSSGKMMVFFLYPRLVVFDQNNKKVELNLITKIFKQPTRNRAAHYEHTWKLKKPIENGSIFVLADSRDFDKRMGRHNEEQYQPQINSYSPIPMDFGHFKSPYGSFDLMIK